MVGGQGYPTVGARYSKSFICTEIRSVVDA
jgi:hypothetical protein